MANPVAPDANAAQLAVLAEHDRVTRATQVPIFRGDKIGTARDWLVLFENAARIAAWNNDRKCAEFQALLRDGAAKWWRAQTKTLGLNEKSWKDIEAAFLIHYDVKGTAKTMCSNFVDLKQKPRENVGDFFSRVSFAFEKFRAGFPEARIKSNATDNAELNGQPLADASKMEGIEDTFRYFLEQMYVAGLHDRVRLKVMESGVIGTGLREVFHKAIELERLDQEQKGTLPEVKPISAVNAIAAVPASEEDNGPSEGLEEDELMAVNAIRQAKGRPPYQKGKGGPNNGNKGSIQCRYCKKFGHMQSVCKSRIRDGAPMVGADGKPYQPRAQGGAQKPNFAVKALGNFEEDDDEEPNIVGYVGSVGRRPASTPSAPLNW